MDGLDLGWGQLGVAGALTGLLLLLGRAFIRSIDRRVAEVNTAHAGELERLTEQFAAELGRLTRQHERELGDMRTRAESWELAFGRKEAQIQELWALNGKLQAGNDTAVQMLAALRRVADERSLGAG